MYNLLQTQVATVKVKPNLNTLETYYGNVTVFRPITRRLPSKTHLNNFTTILLLQRKKQVYIHRLKNLIIQFYQLIDLLTIFLENFNISKATEKF
jgi:hypothetical protein